MFISQLKRLLLFISLNSSTYASRTLKSIYNQLWHSLENQERFLAFMASRRKAVGAHKKCRRTTRKICKGKSSISRPIKHIVVENLVDVATRRTRRNATKISTGNRNNVVTTETRSTRTTRGKASNSKQKLYFDNGVVVTTKRRITRTKNKRISEDRFLSSDVAESVVENVFNCGLCVEDKSKNEMFNVKGCAHSYCSDCIAKYVASKLQDKISNIACPVVGCDGRLELLDCRSILPSQVFDKWGDALCEALIPDSEKFYCPYKDCSALLIAGDDESITSSECPICRRLFCASCKVTWHSDISCEDFQKLDENEREREDIMLMNLARRKMWKRCPKCRFYIEKISGCSSVYCTRCGTGFNYGY